MPIIGDAEFVICCWPAGGSSGTVLGGGATKVAWDANSPSDFMNTTTGASKVSQAGCTIDSDAGEIRLTSAGNFAGVIDGSLVYVNFSATYTTARYVVSNQTANSITLSGTTWSTDVPTASAEVGGCWDDINDSCNQDSADADTYSKYIYVKGDFSDTANIIMSNTYAGTLSTPRYVQGVDTSWVPVPWYEEGGTSPDDFPAITMLTSRYINISSFTSMMGFDLYNTTSATKVVELTGNGASIVNCRVTSSVANGVAVNVTGGGSWISHCAIYSLGTGTAYGLRSTTDFSIYGSYCESKYSGLWIEGNEVNIISGNIIVENGASTGYGIYDTSSSGNTSHIVNNTIRGFVDSIYYQDTLTLATTPGYIVNNNIFADFSGYAVNSNTGETFRPGHWGNNWYSAASSGFTNMTIPDLFQNTELSANPFVSVSDHSLNDTAGGGLVARTGCVWNDYLDEVQRGFLPVGALLYDTTASSGGGLITHPGMSGGMRG